MTPIDARATEIFRLIVEEYLQHGVPIGSRTISRSLQNQLSAATIRNVMADLEDAGLLSSPHTSAGRQPTQRGLRFFIDTMMQVDNIAIEQQTIERHLKATPPHLSGVYHGVSSVLSGLSSCIGIVIAPKMSKPIRKIEFLKLEPFKVLAILITQDGMVENRMIKMADDVTRAELEQASNFLNDRLAGRTLSDVQATLMADIEGHQTNLSRLSAVLMQEGVIHPLSSLDDGHIFVNGQSHLFNDPSAQYKLEEIKALFSLLDEKRAILDILGAVENGEGVQIFIGSENPIFEQPNWSTIIRAYRDQNGRIIGATGVIGPTRLPYGKIVPIVDYTSLMLERLINTPSPDEGL